MLKPILDSMKRKWKLTTVVSVIVIAGGIAGWNMLGNKEITTAEAATAAAQTGTIEVTVSGTGSVKPAVSRSISSNVSGTITNINVKNGQQVKKGDLLFELNNENIENDIKRANLDLQQAQLEYNKKLDEINKQTVYAPISGQVSQLEAESGQDMQKNSSLLVITDTTKIAVKVLFNGAQIANIKSGQKVDVTIPALMTTLQGRVKKVDNGGTASSDGSIMYNVTIEVPNPGALTPGLTAQTVIYTEQGQETSYEPGLLEWSQTITVRAGTSGVIDKLYVDEKAYVKKGQKLAYINSDSLDTELTSQRLRLEQSRLNLAEMQKELADCKIYASVDGTVDLNSVGASQGGTGGSSQSSSSSEGGGDDYLRVGDQITSNQVLAYIVGTAGMMVTVPVDEVDIAKVNLGQKATVTADALPDRTFNGVVTEIASKGTENNGVASFDVTVNVNEPRDLKENMTANVEIMIAKKEGALLLPVEAVQERQGRKFVQVPTTGGNNQANTAKEAAGSGSNASGSGNQVVGENGNRAVGVNGNRQSGMVLVETGLYNDTLIEITSGLKEGDKVILSNTARSGAAGANGRPSGGFMFGGGGSRPSGGSGMPAVIRR